MTAPSENTRIAKILWILMALFGLRVVGQVLVELFDVRFLPPSEEWFSGAIPYPQLLASQIAILALQAKIGLDFTRRTGWSYRPRRLAGTFLLPFAAAYLAVMIIRYIVRMGLYPHERWTGGSIPIFFHWVLAIFLLIVAGYHKRGPIRRKLAISAPIAIGVLAWIAYQLAPWALGRTLGFRPGEFAVRSEHVEMKT